MAHDGGHDGRYQQMFVSLHAIDDEKMGDMGTRKFVLLALFWPALSLANIKQTPQPIAFMQAISTPETILTSFSATSIPTLRSIMVT
jgi:hypothetical protein